MNKFWNNFPKYAAFSGFLIPLILFTVLFINKMKPRDEVLGVSKARILSASDYVQDTNSSEITYKKIDYDYLEGRVIVGFKKSRIDLNSNLGKFKKVIFEATQDVDIKKEFSNINTVVMEIPDNENVLDKINELKSNPDVLYAEPDIIQYPMSYTPDDTFFSTQYSLNNTGQTVNGTAGTSDADMDVPEMWDIENAEGTEVTVGIIDTGLNTIHSDIASNVVAGYNFTVGSTEVEDIRGHGSHVAGIIAGVSNNNTGISGISRYNKLKVMPLKVSIPEKYDEGKGYMSTSNIIDAIQYAQSHNVKVINMSLASSTYSPSEYNALAAYSGLAVIAAGNDGKNNDSAGHTYPCDFDLPNILCVAATDQNDALASYSNYGSTSVDIGAPGSDVNSLRDGKLIYSENFNDMSSIFSGSPVGSWAYYGSGSDYFPWVEPHNPYGDNLNINLSSSNVLFSGSSISNAKVAFYYECYLENSNDADGYNGDVDVNDTDYLNFYTYSNSAWNFGVRFKNLNSSGTVESGDITYAEKFGSPISDYRIKYNFVSNGATNSYYGCIVDDVNVYDRNSFDNTSYTYLNGTSMATPNAAGVAAMLWSYKPSLTVAQVKSIMMNTGDSLSALSGKTVSGKRVNAYNAYNKLIPPTLAEVTPVTTPTQDSTPNYTFSSTEAGTITYGGSCSSATTSAIAGSNTITFNTLSPGTYSNCTITVTDSDSNASSALSVSSFTISSDLTPPTLSEITPIGTTNDVTPTYVFGSDEAGTITYGGSCLSSTTTAISGTNPVTFNTLTPGTYSNCTIKVTDASLNTSLPLNVTTFTIIADTTPPTLTEVTPIGTTTSQTPSYTFNTSEAGSITYGGACTSATTTATSGNNTVTFNTLAAGSYTNCTIKVTDSANNDSNVLHVTDFTIVDVTPPVLTEVDAIGSTTDTTPDYTFNTNEAGSVTYSGSCSSATTAATVGNNTITFNELALGTYTDCKLTVIDSATNQSTLNISSFSIVAQQEKVSDIKTSNNNRVNNKYKYGTKVKISTSDSGYTVKYKWKDKDDWRTYNSKKGLTLPEGKSKLKWKIIDGSGTTVEERSKNFITQKADPIKSYMGSINKELTDLTLTWSIGSPKVESVKIYRGNEENFEVNEKSLIGENKDIKDENYTDGNAPADGYYYYKLVAYDKDGESLEENTLGTWMKSKIVPTTNLASSQKPTVAGAKDYRPEKISTTNQSVISNKIIPSYEPINIIKNKGETPKNTERYMSDKSTLIVDSENIKTNKSVDLPNPLLSILGLSIANALIFAYFSSRKNAYN